MKTKQEADNYLKQYVKEKSGHTMRVGEVADFRLTGEEDEDEIEEYANDYLSDLDSEKAEYSAHRKSMGYCDDSPSLDMNLQY